MPLLCRGGVLVSDPPIEAAELEPLPLPDGVAAGRYHLYRRNRAEDRLGPAVPTGSSTPVRTDQADVDHHRDVVGGFFPAAAVAVDAEPRSSAPTSSGVTQIWSRRRPRSLAAQSRLR